MLCCAVDAKAEAYPGINCGNCREGPYLECVSVEDGEFYVRAGSDGDG